MPQEGSIVNNNEGTNTNWTDDYRDVLSGLHQLVPAFHTLDPAKPTIEIVHRLNQHIDSLERLRDRLVHAFICPFCGKTYIPPSIDTLPRLLEAIQEQDAKGWSSDCSRYHLYKLLETEYKNQAPPE